jgi:hypothetical protein
MPYQPFDTGWTASIYSILCLGWFLFSNGLLPRFTMYSVYNSLYIPFSKAIISLCESIGRFQLAIGTHIIATESMIFNRFDYIQPIFNIIKYVESSMPTTRSPPSSLNYRRCNLPQRRVSSGKHLGSYFAKKRLHQRKSIISHPKYPKIN